MKNVLIVSGIIPAPLEKKLRENDILFKTEEEFKRNEIEVNFHYLMVIPYSNFVFALFSKKWREYYRVLKRGCFESFGRNISVIGIPGLKGDMRCKGILNTLGYYLNKRKISKLLKDYHIDLVHAQNFLVDAGVAYGIKKQFGIPYILTCRGGEAGQLYPYIIRYMEASRSLICLNHRQMKLVRRFQSKAYLIPHGIEDVYLNTLSKIENFSPTGGSNIKLVTVSRLLDWKNIDVVLNALGNITQDFIYDIYGDGPDRERLVGVLNQLDLTSKVRFQGFISNENLMNILPQYDVFILLSYPETFGRVFVEAMAAGVPLIAAKNTGIDGFVQDGDQGFLVDHRNPKEVEAALRKIIEDSELRSGMKRRAFATAKNFSWRVIVKQLGAVYNDINDDSDE